MDIARLVNYLQYVYYFQSKHINRRQINSPFIKLIKVKRKRMTEVIDYVKVS